MIITLVFLTVVFTTSFTQNADTDVCSLPPDSGICMALFMIWYYDPTTQECREFVFGGCGGNGNRFRTEDECYAVCKEKLIQLHPPQNVTLAFAKSNRVYLYWYPPINYVLHEPSTDNGTSSNISYTVNGSSDETKVSNIALPENNKSISTHEITSTTKPTNTTSKNDDSKTGEGNATANVAGKTEEGTITAGTNLSIKDYIGKDKVPFHFARLTHYMITVQLATGEFVKNVSVLGNTTEKNLTGLQSSTEYRITVSAVYLTNSTISAKAIKAKTAQDPSMASKCFCDPYGTKPGNHACNLSLTHVPWCECKPRYGGLFCEICQHGYYRTAHSMPCHSCPCPKTFSTGSCHFVEGYLHCITCLKGYTGNLCHRCANGYYRDHRSAPSKCVKCHGCHNVKPGLICDPFTGKCLNCHYNTTGDKCDRCLDGFQGDPINNVPCTPIAESQKAFKTPSAGIIAAVVVGTIVLLSGIVGFIVYKRSHNFPKHKPFWTIEFKEDHEDVNFSAVPEDELERQHEDMNFYETQTKGKNKLPPYAQLKEDI